MLRAIALFEAADALLYLVYDLLHLRHVALAEISGEFSQKRLDGGTMYL